jgi:hypothetical protein
LLYIAQTRDAVLGGAALFSMGLGMGAPLLAVGVFSRSFLPKTGPWMEAVKKFFVQENDAERLNLNALAMIGVGEGAIIAAQWSVGDLNFPSIGSIKQGQDVKLLVLVSPVRTHKGVSLEDSLNDPLLASLPFLIVVGETSKQMGDAERVVKRLETIKKRFSRGEPVGLEFAPFATSLTGHALVNDDPKVIPKIVSFLDAALVKNAPRIPWVERP